MSRISAYVAPKSLFGATIMLVQESCSCDVVIHNEFYALLTVAERF
jgi:hypothetical protein